MTVVFLYLIEIEKVTQNLHVYKLTPAALKEEIPITNKDSDFPDVIPDFKFRPVFLEVDSVNSQNCHICQAVTAIFCATFSLGFAALWASS